MAKNMNSVPKVDKTARNQAKKIPTASMGTGNPGAMVYGPGRAQTNATNPATTTGKPGINKGRRS